MKIQICEELVTLSRQFKKLGAKLYVVGGYIRDYLIDGTISEDIDICSSLTPDKLKEIQGFEIGVSNTFLGTAYIIKNGKKFEHTTFRVECYNNDGSHSPCSVEFTTDIYSDSFRRDFTLNTIYYDIEEDEIIDFYGGMQDITDRTVKAIISPEFVFANDGIRLLRMVRFTCALPEFSIDKETFRVAKKFNYQLNDITSSRIYEELEKIILSDKFTDGISMLARLKVYKYIFKGVNELPINKSIDDLIIGYKFRFLGTNSVREHRMELFVADIITMCYENCYDKNVTIEGISDYILDRRNFSLPTITKNIIKDTLWLINEFEKTEDEREKKALLMDNIHCINLVKTIGKKCKNCQDIDILYNRLTSKGIALSLENFCLKGYDIMAAGLSGKNVGLALNDMLMYGVMYEISDKSTLMKVLEKLIEEKKYD